MILDHLTSLSWIGCRDPGIQPRSAYQIDDDWIWSDRVGGRSLYVTAVVTEMILYLRCSPHEAFSPRGSQYCSDANVMLAEVG